MYACRAGSTGVIEFLLDELKMQDSKGRTASMHAAESNKLEALAMVIS